MRTFLVAMVAHSEADLHRYLGKPEARSEETDSYVDQWWIAEDDRQDGSDNDSAIFVPRGAQSDVASLLRQWIESKADLWSEEGYPYRETDVSGYWF